MSFVLAVEPDDSQVKLLRGLVSGPDTELVVVVSPRAALDAISRRMPDLVLLSESLGFKSQPVIDRLRTLPTAANVKTLTIPSLTTTDPEAFAAEVMLCLLQGKTPAAKDVAKPAGIAPEVHEAHIALLQADAEARLASELERVRRESAEQRAAELARLEAEGEEKRRAEVAAARVAATEEARQALTSELAGIRGEAQDLLTAELARVRDEAAQKLAVQLEEADLQRSAAVEQARLAAEQVAREALEAEVARIKAETDGRLASELQRVHGEAEQARATAQQTKQEAEAAVAAEVERVRMESEARLEAELARARAEAEEALRAQQAMQVDLEAPRAVAPRPPRRSGARSAGSAAGQPARNTERGASGMTSATSTCHKCSLRNGMIGETARNPSTSALNRVRKRRLVAVPEAATRPSDVPVRQVFDERFERAQGVHGEVLVVGVGDLGDHLAGAMDHPLVERREGHARRRRSVVEQRHIGREAGDVGVLHEERRRCSRA